MGKIYKSTWELNQNTKWSKYNNNFWKDFALVVFENDNEMVSKGVSVWNSKINFANDGEIATKGTVIETLNRSLIFENESEMGVSVFVSTTNFYEMLIYFLPWYDKINYTMQNICKVLDTSFRYLEEQTDKIERNLDLDRAIELLGHYEKRLGIKTNDHISYIQRRNQIRAVLNNMHEQITEKAIKELCSAFSNNNSGVEVLRTEKTDVFEIRFVSGGLPNNIDALKTILYKNIPAHIDLEFTFTQNSWDMGTDGGRLKWKDVVDISWTEFNRYKG